MRDGFELAEIDLELRGEGELVGTRQHGIAQFRVAELPRDAELLERARAHAERIDSEDPELELPEHALLARRAGARLRQRGAGADPGVSRCGDRGIARRRDAGRAPRARDAADGRAGARGAVLDPRAVWQASGCSTCSRDPARWRSRRSRAERARRRWSTARRQRSRPSGATSRRLGTGGRSSPPAAPPRSSTHARTRARQYDLVFLDPPYRQASEAGRELSRALAPVLAPAARVVAESDRRAPLMLDLPLLDERRYGDTLIRIHG